MKKIISAALAGMLVLSFAACGSSSSTASGTSQASTSTASASTASSVVESALENATDDSLQRVIDAGKLVMLTNATFPPYEYLQNTADNAVIVNGFTGVDIELAYMIAEEIGVELEIVDMNFDLLIDSLNNGAGDIVAAGMSITEERQKNVDFSTPYVDTYLSVLLPADSELTVDDLDGLVFSVQENTTSDLLISDPEGWGLSFTPGTIMRFKNAVEAGNAVAQGNTDVAVIDMLTAQNIVNSSNGQLKLLDETVGHEQYAMALAKGSNSLMEVVNQVLSEAYANGTVDELIEKHMEISKA